MNVLGIETSCDETAAAIVADGRRTLSNVVSSQWDLHRKHGGIVPELAARGQVKAILPVLSAAMEDAGIDRKAIDVIAVTNGPGLAGSLLVGVNVAKALAYSLARPLVSINHLEAHIYANWLSEAGAEPPPPPRFPALCLLVSGGHTELILMTGHGHYQHLGRTLDDAAGEAFDKGARLLGIGFPGGPAIESTASMGDLARYAMPRAWLGDNYDFSFSGLKTALLRQVEPYRLPDEPLTPTNGTPFAEHLPPRYRADLPVADLAAAFQEAIVDVLAVKTARAAEQFKVRTVMLAGGVAANLTLRNRIDSMIRLLPGEQIAVRFPPVSLCTDNAAMIGGCGYFALRRGVQVGWELDVEPRLLLAMSD